MGRPTRVPLVAAAVLLLAAGGASATTIDFSGLSQGQDIGNTYESEGVVFSGAEVLTCEGGCPAPNVNGNFAYAEDGSSFTADFLSSQNLVTFQTVSNSSTLAEAFNSMGTLVASVSDEESSPITNQIDTLAGTDITSVVFSYDGGINGPAPTNITFGASAAPEPSSWLLMIAGIGGIGLMMRRAKTTMGFRFKDALSV